MNKFFLLVLFFVSFLTACSVEKSPSLPESKTEDKKIILALWDSLTAGLWVSEDMNYPAQLEAKLKERGYSYTLQNAGVSWDTSAGLLSRMDWILDGTKPSFAILCIGANDAFQGKSVEDIEKNIRSILEKLQAKNIPILFAGMKAPLNLGWEYGRQYESMFERLAKEYKVVFMPFFLQWVALRANLNQDDRIHPTASWYAVVVENLMEILEDENMIIKE